jgi:hypothetical protein
MKYYTFYRENNVFDDILSDITIKKIVRTKISWLNYLMVGIEDEDKIASYITLKFGDSIRTDLVKDFSPIPFKDYTPIRNSNEH